MVINFKEECSTKNVSIKNYSTILKSNIVDFNYYKNKQKVIEKETIPPKEDPRWKDTLFEAIVTIAAGLFGIFFGMPIGIICGGTTQVIMKFVYTKVQKETYTCKMAQIDFFNGGFTGFLFSL